MLLEILPRWPFVRRHVCLIAPIVPVIHPPPPANTHLTWVQTAGQRGFLHHHEADGWVIQLENGALVKRTTAQFEHLR